MRKYPLPGQTNKTSRWYALAWILCFSCGVDVGNPTKPVAPTAEEQEALALVSSEQLDETLAATSDSQNGNETDLLLQNSSLCEVNADGTVRYTIDKDTTASVDLPRRNPKKRLTEKTAKKTVNVLRGVGDSISCRLGDRRPLLDWDKLSQVNVEITSTRSTERVFSSLPDGSLDKTISVNVSSNRGVAWEKVSSGAGTVKTKKAVHFQSMLERVSSLETSPYATTVETADDIVIEQTFTIGQLNQFKIVSGKVLSDYTENKKLVLSYSNLEFINGATCYPASGSIAASIVQADNLTLPVLSFSIIFDQGQASLLFDDGTQKDLELADCSLKSN